MTIEDFKKTEWGAGMKCIYRGEEKEVNGVAFDECLVSLEIDWWVRCENIELVD